jgi:hypothetical protein
MKADQIKTSFLESSKRRLEFLKVDLNKASSRNKNDINQHIIDKYLNLINEKEIIFHDQVDAPLDIKIYDISELESDISLLLEDVVLNEKDCDNLYSTLKAIFYEIGYLFVFYPAIQLMSSQYQTFQEVFFIGVPIGILYEKKYFPLVLHEIGHIILDKGEFTKFTEAITGEIDRMKQRAMFPSNLDNINLRLLNRAKLYERLSKPWLSELVSDMFGAYMAGTYYLEAFFLYQLNKRYFEEIDDHPTNYLRYIYLKNYLIKTKSMDASNDELESLVNTNSNVDSRFKLLGEIQYQEYIFEGFRIEIKNKVYLDSIKKKITKLLMT